MIANIIDAIAKGMFHESMKVRMDGLEKRETALTAQLEQLPEEDPIALHPRLTEIYAAKIRDLIGSLNAPGVRGQAAEILRGVIEKVVLVPDEWCPGNHAIELRGDLAAILSMCGGDLSARRRPAVVAGLRGR